MVGKWCLCNVDVEKRPNNPLVVCQCETIPIVLKFQNTEEALSYCQKHPLTGKTMHTPSSTLLSSLMIYQSHYMILSSSLAGSLLLGLTLLLWKSSPVLSVSWSPLFLYFASVVRQERTWERLRPTVKQTCWAVFFQQNYKAQDDSRHAEECHYCAQSFLCTLISTKILVNTYQMHVHRYCTDGPAYADKQGWKGHFHKLLL